MRKQRPIKGDVTVNIQSHFCMYYKNSDIIVYVFDDY